MSAPRDFDQLVSNVVSNSPHKQSPTTRRVRGLFDAVWVFDTTNARHVWEHPYYPQLYIPIGDFSEGALTKGNPLDSKKTAFHATLKGRKKSTEKAVIFASGALEGYVTVEFAAIDQWFEEDTPIYQHPKDPEKRIDILPASRTVRVEVDGVVIAHTTKPVFLLETGLPTRYYVPKVDVSWEYLTESDLTTVCPYKGRANYYNVEIGGKIHEDLVWWYRYPTAESAPIAGLVCFYNEKVDIYIDSLKLKK